MKKMVTMVVEWMTIDRMMSEWLQQLLINHTVGGVNTPSKIKMATYVENITLDLTLFPI